MEYKPIIEVKKLKTSYAKKVILEDISFKVERGEIVGVLGENGAGKTTLIRTLMGFLKPDQGEIFFHGQNMHTFDRRDLARKVALVPQLIKPYEGLTVSDFISLGRLPYLNRFSFVSVSDRQKIKKIILDLDLFKKADTYLDRLSGGEFQRAAIARALVQETQVVFLDEPTAHLDLKYQMKILALLETLKSTKAILVTFHDLYLARDFCDRIIFLKEGRILVDGKVAEALTADNLFKVYGVVPKGF